MTKRTLTIIITVMTILTLTACGNVVVATTPVQDQPQVEPKQEVVAEPTAEVVEEQPEVTEEVVEPEVLTLEDWAKSVQTTEVVFGIYNENTNEGKLLETAELDKNTIDEVVDEYISLEKYSVTDGDLLVIVCPGTGHKQGGTANILKYGDFYGVYKAYNISESFYFGYDGYKYKVKYDFN